jgi:hypothetical protein
LALVLALAFGGATGCDTGRPGRASDIQNTNAISDDIAAVRMMQSPSRIPNPNSDPEAVRVYAPLQDYGSANGGR